MKESNTQVEYKPVVGFEGYIVSSEGEVFSLKLGTKTKRKATNCSKGYARMDLYGNGKRSSLKVHRIVAQAFLPNPENKPQVNHINSVRDDNRLENLEWVTASENTIHGVIHGAIAQGQDTYGAVFTNDQVLAIYHRLMAGEKSPDLAVEFGVQYQIIDGIRSKSTYKCVTEHLPDVKRMSLAGTNNSQSKFSEEVIIDVYQRLLKGESGASIGRDHSMSAANISNIRTRKRHAEITSHLPDIT